MRRRSVIQAFLASAVLPAHGRVSAQPDAPDAAASLAPGGRVRIAINYGNAVLARRDPASGELTGVSVDIARELGRRLGVPITLVPFDAAGKVSAAAKEDRWDVAFLARDPERARDISFTAPYVVINGTFVVRKGSPYDGPADIDREGVRIAVSGQSIYDLFLARSLKHATIVRAGSPPEAAAKFRSDRLEVCAGVQTAMLQLVATDASLRMIEQPFMQINQAMGTPAGRTAGAAWLGVFVESIKADGFVQKTLVANAQADASVAPPD